ncbi:MAG: hypothetical protein ABEJ36_02595 [Candidatus Nanosalina sp.]
MSQRRLLTAHPEPEKDVEIWDSDLESIEDFATDRYGISENPYSEPPSVHPRYEADYISQDGAALNTVTLEGRDRNVDKERVINTLLNRTPAEYVSLIHSSDHEWDANGWVYFRDGRDLKNENYFGEPDEEGRDVRRQIEREFDIEPHIPFF